MSNNVVIQELLVEVAAINKKYENIEEVTGANFNIFKIMRMETDEVRTHSRFIAELLNPSGSHGQKDVFLVLFINAFKRLLIEKAPNLADVFDILKCDISTTEIKVEEVIENGRVDIVMKFSNGQVVVIENKIYAADQYGQLARYKNKYPKCYLIYLTLNGGKATDFSNDWANEKNEKISVHSSEDCKVKCENCYFSFSYKKDILDWLRNCQKESSAFPILRETIAQYINLIKHLTHQTMSDQETKEIIDEIIKDSKKIAAAEEIFNNWQGIQKAAMVKFQFRLKEIKNELNVELNFDFNGGEELGKIDSGFWLYRKGWKYCIYFCFLEGYYMKYGIDLVKADGMNMKNKTVIDDLKIILGSTNANEENGTWLWVNSDVKLDNYGFEEFVTEGYKNYIKEMINGLLVKIDEALKDETFKNNWLLTNT